MFINTHRKTYGVELICKVLQIAPSTYYWHLERGKVQSERERDGPGFSDSGLSGKCGQIQPLLADHRRCYEPQTT